MESRYIADEFARNFALLAADPGPLDLRANIVQADMEAWPVACESVDTLILPHLLEFEADPHRVLAEAERVLRPEGRLFILGFNPWSLEGLLRHRRRSPTFWSARFIGCPQIVEWLNLIKFEAEFSAGFGFPSRAQPAEPRSAWQKSVARLSAAYAVKAVKRTWTPIPIGQAWLSAPGLVPGQAIAPPLMRK